ncbi:hypothetical protein DV515_00018757 [Chloebia gouldiae]|uniref:Uncharacterized protein n=1 Tax=Chloebia gouldiae TaxID=44316 RepID=A0A3L8Q6L4_CHLGU|nr:hypothetical protein DV515_00018757 [Chloebia gouldiae]
MCGWPRGPRGCAGARPGQAQGLAALLCREPRGSCRLLWPLSPQAAGSGLHGDALRRAGTARDRDPQPHGACRALPSAVRALGTRDGAEPGPGEIPRQLPGGRNAAAAAPAAPGPGA